MVHLSFTPLTNVASLHSPKPDCLTQLQIAGTLSVDKLRVISKNIKGLSRWQSCSLHSEEKDSGEEVLSGYGRAKSKSGISKV